MRYAVLLGACCGFIFAQTGIQKPDLQKTLHGIEDRYNNIKTLKVNFTETVISRGGRHVPQSGILYLRKPGRMRWEYTMPPGKLFLSDNQFTYDYDPASNHVDRDKLKNGDDPRGPLAFLLGKVDFGRDFSGQYEVAADGAITAFPKSADMPYRQMTFSVGPDFSIKKLSVTQQDGSVIDYTFGDEIKNPPLPEDLFKFTPPPGAVVIDSTHPEQ